MQSTVLKRFESPDGTRTFEKGRLQVVRMGAMTVGRASYEPGWKWSEPVGRAPGQPLCHVEHVGMVVFGRAAVRMQDGTCYGMAAGDRFCVAPGHHGWVGDDEPYVSIHFMGADRYAHGAQSD